MDRLHIELINSEYKKHKKQLILYKLRNRKLIPNKHFTTTNSVLASIHY